MVGAANDQLYKGMLQVMLLGPLISRAGNQKIAIYMAEPSQKDLVAVKELLEAGKVVPVVEKTYPLSETAEALRYFEEGHVKGKLVITV